MSTEESRHPGVELAVAAVDGGRVARLSVRGRTRLNLAGAGLLDDLARALSELAVDDSLRCVVLTGTGEAAFIGGADLHELRALDPSTAGAFIGRIHAACVAIRTLPVPVIAELRGFCLGAGLEIAAACDFRYAADDCRLGMPEVRVGVPSVVEACLLPRLIGWGRTRELLYRGHVIDAAAAGAIGLVERVCAPDRLRQEVDAAVADIVAAAPAAVRAQKALCSAWEDATVDAAVTAGIEAFVTACSTTEPRRYIDRFFAGRARN